MYDIKQARAETAGPRVHLVRQGVRDRVLTRHPPTVRPQSGPTAECLALLAALRADETLGQNAAGVLAAWRC